MPTEASIKDENYVHGWRPIKGAKVYTGHGEFGVIVAQDYATVCSLIERATSKEITR